MYWSIRNWASYLLLALFLLGFLPNIIESAYDNNLQNNFLPPFEFGANFLGTNSLGQDTFSMLLVGAKISLGIALLSTIINFIVGTTLGLLAGYYGKLIDLFLYRLSELLQALPNLILVLALASVMNPSFWTLILALTLTGWIGFMRVARAQALELSKEPYVEACHALGQKAWVIMLRHLFPNLLPTLLIQFAFSAGVTILIESTLSFLGLGLPAGTPSWGAMIADGRHYLFESPHLIFFPGILLSLCVYEFNRWGEVLKSRLNIHGKAGNLFT